MLSDVANRVNMHLSVFSSRGSRWCTMALMRGWIAGLSLALSSCGRVGFDAVENAPVDAPGEALVGDALLGCTNGARDGLETDIDCGGGVCGGCAVGQMCAVKGDCAGALNLCVSGRCKFVVVNGREVNRPVCPDGGEAVRLAGRWESGHGWIADPAATTVACPGFALAKCAALGMAANTTTLDACVRAITADYCGDDGSWTVDGTPIMVVSAGADPGPTAGELEARWGPHGAICADRRRVGDGRIECPDGRRIARCPAPERTGSIVTRTVAGP